MERPQLERRLHPPIRVVSVVAGPGYGKTVLAARWHDAWSGPKVWYSLDDGDADLALFAAHLHTAVATTGAQLRPFDEANASSVGAPREVAIRFAEALADLASPPLLVFDDVHVLEGSRSLVALNELIERASRLGATFVVAGRSLPLSLHGVAASAQLASVGAGDLAFDGAETEAYIQRAAHGEAAHALTRMAQRAEGWPAGLALIATSMADAARPIALPQSDSAEDARRHLFSYLANEVLERLSAPERRFLLDTSILDPLETNLCDALRDEQDSARILESLADRGLFVSRQSEDAYRCHQLFREFLCHQLAQLHNKEYVSRLHRRAADFLSARGSAGPAVAHFIAAGDADAAVAEFEKNAFAMLHAGLVQAVNQLLRQIDPARVDASATLLVARGRVLRERGEWDAALAALERSISQARQRGEYDVLAEAVRSCAPMLAARGEFERLSSMLNEALSPGLDLPETSVTRLRMTLAAVYLEMDKLEESLAMYREIMPSIVAHGDLAAHGLVLHNTAVAHLRRGDVFAGLSLYERALKLKEAAGQRLSLLTTLGDLIYAKTLLGDLDDAEKFVESLLVQAEDVGASGIIVRAHEERGVLRLLRGDLAGATHAFRSAAEACDPSDLILLPEIEHGLAKCELAAGKLAEADAFCARASEMFRGNARHQQLAPILVTRAEVMLARGDVQSALRLASEAIDEAGQGVNALLQAVACLDAAAALVRCAARLSGSESIRADRRAAEAATIAVALVHQRDYRFLVRTKADVFSELAPHLRRWKVGASLLPEIAARGPASSLRIETLGAFRVFVGGKEVPPEAWKRRRALEIFAYLVSQRGRAVPRDRLIDMYWPESDADAAHDSLRVSITAIRKAVGDVVKYEANSYRFAAPQAADIDFERFDGYIERAHQADGQGDMEEAVRQYEAATDLYHGDFLEGLHEGGWQWHERDRLRAACLDALRWIAQARRSSGDLAGHRRAVERLLEVAPFDLEAVKMRLDALWREQRGAEAERDYREWRNRYRSAVGADAPEIWTAPDGESAEGQAVQERPRDARPEKRPGVRVAAT
jgi:LuxR family maltose regulon positive regulatory protein